MVSMSTVVEGEERRCLFWGLLPAGQGSGGMREWIQISNPFWWRGRTDVASSGALCLQGGGAGA